MARKIGIDKEKIIKLHNLGATDREIAEKFGCTRANITHCLNKAGYNNRKSKIENIDLRNRISETLIGRFVGEKNPNYKGYNNEKIIARGIFKTFSKRKIRESNYTCSACGKRGGDLETHHIKPFSLIFNEFINARYDGNIGTIYKQLMSYSDFINEDNMVVLCHKCHFKVHHSDNCELSPYRWESATTIEKGEAEKDCFDN